MFFEVIPTEVFRQGGGVLTYISNQPLRPGHIVLVPLGRRQVTGIVLRRVQLSSPPQFQPKAISRLIHPTPLPTHLLKTALWLSKYYLSPLPSCANLLIPAGLTAKFKPPIPPANASLKLPLIPLSPAQKQALSELSQVPSNTALLRGITGSGKTNVYLKLTADTLKSNRSAILLVPEIALTSQLTKIFEQTFGDRVVLIHSGQTMSERRATWLEIQESQVPLVVIGPRSALLTPIHDLGLIIIDECHESAYFQENTPRYSALRLASFIASTTKASCIFGSATPNLVDYHLARSKKSLVELTEKAKKTALAPEISIVDLKDRANFTRNRYFSNKLLTSIQKNIEAHHQTLIFHNRRGSAPLTICENCGWQALCPECYLPMTLHTDSFSLCCHICGHEEKVPTTCPDCKNVGIIHKGFGTKLLESELRRLFPDLNIARFDGDNQKQNGLANLYQSVKSGEIDLLIGTQTLARGLDLPHLATVGIIQADAGLALPDFAAEERTFELLTQVIGRVGRGHLDTASVIVQTYQPDHEVIHTALQADYPQFAAHLLKKRRLQALPPFTHLARLSVTYKTEKTTLAKITAAREDLMKHSPHIEVLNTAPAFHEHTNRGFTWQIILKSTSRAALQTALQPYAESPKFTVTLDPPSLL